MDHIGILKRALKITWRNRALWVFGVLLALAGGGGGSGFRYTFGGGPGRGGGSDWAGIHPFNFPDGPFHPGAFIPSWATVAGIVAIVLFVIVILMIVSTIIRYLSENALVKMVDQVEVTGETGTVGEGFRKGWSRPAFRMFLINLVIGIPTAIVAIFLIMVGLSPLLLFLLGGTGAQVLAVVLTIGLMLLVIGVLIIAGIVLGLLTRLAFREVALGDKGVFDAIRDAYWLIRRNLSDVGLIWLLMLAVGIGWGLIMIPVVLLLLVLAGVLGGIPAALAYTLTQSIGLTTLIGAPIGLLTLFVPLLFLSGLYVTFVSSVWTLTYRELIAKEVELTEEPASDDLLTAGPEPVGTE